MLDGLIILHTARVMYVDMSITRALYSIGQSFIIIVVQGEKQIKTLSCKSHHLSL
jgi:hypothetical protein